MRHPHWKLLGLATLAVASIASLLGFRGPATSLAVEAVATSAVAQTASYPLESSGQVKYLSTNSTQGSFTLAQGRTTTAPSNLFSLGPAYGNRFRGVEITFFGSGSATQTFDYKVWGVKRGFPNINGTQVDYELLLICAGTATLGSTAGAATSGSILTTDLIAHTLSLPTISSYGAAISSAYSAASPMVYSPGSNGMGRLYIPDCGNSSDIIVEFDMTGATSGNCLIERNR